MILVDTSVWIDLLSRKPSYSLSVEQLYLLAVCPPIIQELLQGFPADARYRQMSDAVMALPCVPRSVELSTYCHAADIYRSGRRQGVTIRSSIDCLIAAIALESRLPVWHKDRDFASIARFTELECVAGP
jgi:predicted nucleic acid-binding protein